MVDLWSFHVGRLCRGWPLALLALFAGLACVASTYSTWYYWAGRQEVAQAALSRLQAINHRPIARPPAPVPMPGTDLPPFDNAAFTAAFLATAKDVGVPADEVFYTLESTPEQPYLRYRISLESKSGYPELRKLLAALAVEQDNVVLDAIRCQRQDAKAVALTCQLAFSAFFRKVDHG